MRQRLLRVFVRASMEREKHFIFVCEKCDQRNNPQVICEKLKSQGRLDALDAIYRALKNDEITLRIMAGL